MPDTLITVEEGVLRGGIKTTSKGFKYNYYYSIPYAAPPLGTLRFKNPQPPNKWDGIRDATIQRPCNPQWDVSNNTVKGDEDSLYINIYTPSSATNRSKLPVTFLIHGGGFYMGAGDYTEYYPDQVIDKGILLVTINYRLGPFGFLCLHTPEAPGNVGLKDQVYALRWVQKNIEVFGGDPQNVTLSGESAGAACIHYHMMSPMSRGLFSKTIMQSGTCISSWAIQNDPIKNAFELGDKLGFKTTDKNELIKSLRSVTFKQLVEASKIEYVHTLIVVFCGVVEMPHQDCESFILEPVWRTLNSGNYNIVPCMQGFNSHEGLFLAEDVLAKGVVNGDFLSLDNLKVLIKRHSDIDASTEQARELHSFYFNKDAAAGFVELISDLFFIRDCTKVYDISSRHNKSVYQYYFCYEGVINALKPTSFNLSEGACHDDENQYLYAGKEIESNASQKDLEVMKVLSTMWTNFVKYGNPTPETNEIIKTIWTTTNVNKPLSCLQIKDELKMISLPFSERMEFWKKLFGKF